MSTKRETPELEKFKRLWTDSRRYNWPATFEGEAFAMIAKLERERDKAREREARWKAVARALYYAVGSDMEAKADQAFTALRSEVEG